MKQIPLVAIVGRMNVGKSTLFNRLSSQTKSITYDYAGVTRDLLYDTVSWKERLFELVDTGGFAFQRKVAYQLHEKVLEKTREAVKKADLILFMGDGLIGLLPEDREILHSIHALKKPIIMVINKIDHAIVPEGYYQFAASGAVATVAISAEHGLGIGELLDGIIAYLPQRGAAQADAAQFRVMFLGRPNVGKSSLMNELLRYERSIVWNEPGTTREAISELIRVSSQHLLLTDTPGLRRQSAIDDPLEKNMVYSCLKALDDVHIVLLVIDGSEGAVVDQELKLAFYAFSERNKALIIVINKSDMMTAEHTAMLLQQFELYQHLIKKIPVIWTSCVTHKNTGKILPLVLKIWGRHSQQLPGAQVYTLFMRELEQKPLIRNEQKLIVSKIQQLATAPITIGIQANEPAWFGKSQCAFFENLLRKKYDLVGVPIKFIVRKKLAR